MDMSDFQKRMLGFPMDAQYQQDLTDARWKQFGDIGRALMVAGGSVPNGDRMGALGQALGQVSNPEQTAMNMAQRRLMQSALQAKLAEIQRQDALRQRLSDPTFLQGLGINPQQAEVMGPDGVAELIQKRASHDPLDTQVKMAQIAALQRRDDPKWGKIGTNADGQDIMGFIPAWNGDGQPPAPTGMPVTGSAPAGAAAPEAPAPEGVNVPEYRKKLADEQAKLKAVEIAKKRAEQEEYVPAFNDYVAAFDKAAKAGAIGPVQANSMSRSLFANTENENLRQQVEAAQKRWAYAQALRTYGKLDRGFTDTELNAFLQQGLPLYAADPTKALEAFKTRFGAAAGQQSNSGGDPLAAARAAIAKGARKEDVIKRLQEHGIDTTGL